MSCLAAVPGVALVVLPDAAHLANVEQPAALDAAFIKSLGRLAAH